MFKLSAQKILPYVPVTSLTLRKPQAFTKHQKQVHLSLWGECGNAVFASSWRDSMSEDVRVWFDTGALHGRLCCKKQISPLWFLRVYVSLLQPGPAPFQGWERRLRLSFCLAISSFQNKNRERTREYWQHTLASAAKQRPSLQAFIHPVRMDECAHDNQATRQALLVRHSSTPTMASGLSSKLRVSRPRHVSLFKSTAAFTTTTTPDLEFKLFFLIL